MPIFERRDSADALLDLLERERAAIRAARFDILERLAAEKERLRGAIADSGMPGETLRRLRADAERNAALLGAMRAGVRRAQDRLAAARTPQSFSTYTQTGARVQAGGPGGALARKA